MVRARKGWQSHKQGFTLLESIVAIGVILIGIVSLLALSTTSVVSATATSDAFLASNFAREGIEVVRMVRDSNWLAYDADSTTAWNAALNNGSDYEGIITLTDEPTTGRFVSFLPDVFGGNSCGSIGNKYECTQIWYDPAVHVYFQTAQVNFAQANYQKTQFFRLVTLYPICRDAAGIETIIQSGSCVAGSAQVGIDVISTVKSGDLANNPSTVTLEEYLYDWKY